MFLLTVPKQEEKTIANAMTKVCPKDKVHLGKRGDMVVQWDKDLENGNRCCLNILVEVNYVGEDLDLEIKRQMRWR